MWKIAISTVAIAVALTDVGAADELRAFNNFDAAKKVADILPKREDAPQESAQVAEEA